MDYYNERTTLLGHTSSGRLRRTASRICSIESWRRRVPITIWLPKYRFENFVRDAIAGITVALTSIPQGIAYAIVAGLPPQVGLYSSAFPGIVYAIFGSCKVVTVGPTAILAALLAKYVALSADFAYLAAFLTGCVILLLGVLQLGFLLDFISKPVISGFTTAAALQIGATQLKSLLRLSGASGHTFIDAITNFVNNIKTIHLWDTVLGLFTIVALLLLKRVKLPTSQQSGRGVVLAAGSLQYLVRARNALVVFGAALLAYCLALHDLKPFALTGKIEGGMPKFGLPPFVTVVNNQTVYFEGMLKVFGPEGFVIPLVAILESIAIAKAFAGGTSVDATQEMVALGACNLLGSLAQSMPATGSFTRTALNHASGVTTPAGSLYKAALVLVSLSLLSSAFSYIPRSSLAGVIVVAMMSIVEFRILLKLWNNSKLELAVYLVTVLTGISMGLEWGIAAGVAGDFIRSLASGSRPAMNETKFKVGNQDCRLVTLLGTLSFSSAEFVSNKMRRSVEEDHAAIVIFDGRHLRSVDIGVAENLISVILELETDHYRFMFWNCPDSVERLFEDLHPGFQSRFVTGNSIDQHVLSLELRQRDNNNYNTMD